MSINKVSFWVLRLSIALGILYCLFCKIPLSEVIVSITSAEVSYVIAALVLSILLQFILAYRLKLLTDKQKMSLSTFNLLEINLISVFYGLFLPGGNLTRAVIRFYKIARPDKKWSEGLVSITFDRIVATITLCVTGILFWLIDLQSDLGSIAVSMIVVLGGFLILYILLFDKRTPLSLSKCSKLINLFFFRKKNPKLLDSLNQYQNLPSDFLSFVFVLSIIAQLLGILIYYLLAMSLGINIPFITVGWIRSAVVIITMIPISLSGLGVREGMLLFLLKPYGILGDDALALSFLVYGATLLFIGAIGGLLQERRLFLPETP